VTVLFATLASVAHATAANATAANATADVTVANATADVNWHSVMNEACGTNSHEVFQIIFHVVNKQLHTAHLQWANAAAALVFGCIMLYDGLHMFKIFMLLVTYFSLYLLSVGDLTESYQDDEGKLWIKVVAFEIACVVTFFAWDKENFKLVKKMVGFALGLWAFGELHAGLIDLSDSTHQKVIQSSPFIITAATVCLLFGTWLFTEGPSYVWAFLASLIGGVFVSSSILYFITMVKGSSMPVWWDFVITMNPQSKLTAVGPFENGMFGFPVWLPFNRFVGLFTASVLFLIAFIFQYKQAAKEKANTKANKVSLRERICRCLRGEALVGNFDRQSTADLRPLLPRN